MPFGTNTQQEVYASYQLKAEIEALKKTARSYHATYTRLIGGNDCGAALTEYINPDAAKARQGYEAAVQRLREIDPNFPKDK